MHSVDLLIGGIGRSAATGKIYKRLNPLSSVAVTDAAAAGVEDVDDAVAAAARAFPGWSQLPPAERRARLMVAADQLQARSQEFVDAGIGETGGTQGWFQFNVALAANMLREAAAMATQIVGETIPSNILGCLAISIRKPCGVVVGIAPWNAPVILGVRAVAVPLACGNTVVLKSSEACPRVHRLIGESLQAAGMGDGVVNVISNAPEDAADIVERLITNPAVRRVNFTGSTRVGRIVGELCGRHLKPCVLELGGKAPLLILGDADLNAAVAAAAFGAFMNQGQICMSTERILVDAGIADDFAVRFAAKARTLTAADPACVPTQLGTVLSIDSVHRLRELVDDAVACGAEVIAGGVGDSVLVNATVVDHVTPSMRLFREESFGPVVAITRVKDDEEAVALANDSEYGLSAAVFSRDISRALRAAGSIDAGICHVNSATVHDEPQMPFGGVKASGFGRFGGRYAVDEFTDVQWLTVQTSPASYPI